MKLCPFLWFNSCMPNVCMCMKLRQYTPRTFARLHSQRHSRAVQWYKIPCDYARCHGVSLLTGMFVLLVHLHASVCTQASKKCIKQMHTVRKPESDSAYCYRNRATSPPSYWLDASVANSPSRLSVPFRMHVRKRGHWSRGSWRQVRVRHACGHMTLFTASNKYSLHKERQ